MIAPNFEKLMESVGDSGRHQNLLFWLFVVPINFFIPWVTLVPIFMVSTPSHWCHVPGRPANMTVEEWKALTIPRETKDGQEVFSSCSQFNVTLDLLMMTIDLTSDISGLVQTFNSTYGIISCQSGWDYSHTDYDTTLSMDRNWVCDADSQGANWISVGLAGNVVGTLVFNSVSDFLGRRPAIVVATMMYAVFGLVRLYVENYFWMMLAMFLASTSFPPVLELVLIITLEQVSPGLRARITSTSFLLWTMGMCVLPLLAWLTRDWQMLGLITTLPFFLVILCWWLLPESPRWLLSRDRLEECATLMRTIARRNGKPVPKELDDTLKTIAVTQNTERNYGVVQLFKYPTVRFRTFLLTGCYTFNNLFYYGLAYNITNVSGNEFLNFFLLGIAELPSNLMGWGGAVILGRRWTAAGSFVLASVCALANAIFLETGPWVTIVLLLLSKVFITISFLVVYMQCAEVYPTTHRACGTGFSSLVSSCFGIIAPYIAYLAVYGAWLPYIIICVTGILGYICASLLPETLGADLPQSLLDANNFLTSEKYWSYKGKHLCSCKAKKMLNSAAAQGHENPAISGTKIATIDVN